jgi:hypothetical protein
MNTGSDGLYAFSNNPMYLDYYVYARKVGEADKGVSTIDIALIQRHILGLTPFTDPYDVIAADANYDKKLSATDLIQIRKLILGIYEEFPQNESWRFVKPDEDYTIDNILKTFTERRDIEYLAGNMMAENLIAVKIGDVNGDVSFNSRGSIVKTRNARHVELSFEDGSVHKGDKFEVAFQGTESLMSLGMQFTLAMEGVEYENSKGGVFELNTSNIGLFGDKISVSIHSTELVDLSQELFSMRFVATKDGRISDMLTITSEITSNEVYVGQDLTVRELTLVGNEDYAELKLFQNEPNPFINQTTIGFEMNVDGNANLIIHDVAGKELKRISRFYNKGYNEILVDKQDLMVSGVVYYTLSTKTQSLTRKMIIL